MDNLSEAQYLSFEWIQETLTPDEGELWQIYGKPKNGKTYLLTKLALEDLRRGQTVIANWKIKWEGYDERKDWWCLFLRLFGLKKVFFHFPKENFVFVDPTDSHMADKIERWTDCSIYLDEGQRYYDSYKLTKMEESVRMALALTAHFNRRIIIASQRSMAIHVSLRGNVNRYFKMEKLYRIPFTKVVRFQCTEYQDTIGEAVNEETPEHEDRFWSRKEVYDSYDYKFMRGGVPRSQPNYATAHELGWRKAWDMLFKRSK